MNWEGFPSPRLVELTVFYASICTILAFLGMVIWNVFQFLKKSTLPWQMWLALLLQITIAVVIYLLVEPQWLSTVILWGVIILNELTRQVYSSFIGRLEKVIEEYRDMLLKYQEPVRDTLDHN